MALSDQLTDLTARAKEAEDRAGAAQGKAKADLQADVETARASAQARAKKLRESAEANKNKLSVWWNDLQRTWNVRELHRERRVARFSIGVPPGSIRAVLSPLELSAA